MYTHELIASLVDLIKAIVNSAGFWALCGVTGGSYITANLTWRYPKKAKKKEVYAELIGMKKWMKQVYLSRFEAFLFSDYHEERNRLQNYKNEVDKHESQRWMEKSECLALEAAKAEERLAKIIGLIFCYFRLSKSDETGIANLLDHSIPFIKRLVNQFDDIHELEKTRVKASEDLQRLVEELFDSFFNPAIEILKSRL